MIKRGAKQAQIYKKRKVMVSEQHSSPNIITLEEKKAMKKSVTSWCWEHCTLKNPDKPGKNKYTFDNDGQNSYVECNFQVQKWIRDKENLFAPKRPVSQPCGLQLLTGQILFMTIWRM